MTTANIINYILIRFRDHGLDLLASIALAVGVFIIFFIIINKVVNKVKERIQANSLQEDIYSKKIANLA